jgi:signal transduction histidine kinase
VLINLYCEQIKKNNTESIFQRELFNSRLVTEVIDTGLGIDINRQKNLFVPFKELQAVQTFDEVKDSSSGFGLACSKTIVDQLMGTLEIKQSKRGLTVFSFAVPIVKARECRRVNVKCGFKKVLFQPARDSNSN